MLGVIKRVVKMNPEQINQLLTTVLTSIGGTAVVVGGLSAWLSRLWATRIIEAEKASHSRKLEETKAELNIKNELPRRKRTGYPSKDSFFIAASGGE